MSHSTFNLHRLRAGIKPFRLHWFPLLGSTNNHAAVLRKRGTLFAPAIVLTGRQTTGRGRGSNVWWSSRGSLTVTFVLPIDDQIAPHQLPLIAGLAVRSAVSELTRDDRTELKWPNDLLYEGRKLGGLLCERIMKADLVGLGLNVNIDPKNAPRPLRDRITSLQTITGETFNLNDVLISVTHHLRLALARGTDHPFAQMLREYDQHHALLGKRVSVITSDSGPPLSGKCEGLDSMGRLLLRSGKTLHRVISGQVQ